MSVIGILFTVSSAVSTLCSALVIYRFLQGRKWDKPYDRLVVGLSLSDLIFSATLSFAPIVVHPATKPSPLCTFEAFFKHLGLAGPYYNASLSYFFLLSVVFEIKDRRLARYYEPILHAMAIPFALAACIICMSLRLYNPTFPSETCWIDTYKQPEPCAGADCNRGDPKLQAIAQLAFVYVPLLVVFFSLIANNLWIFCYVSRLERQAKRHIPREFRASIVISDTPSHTQQVASQSFYFVLAYFVSFLPSTLLELVEWIDPDGSRTDKYHFLELTRAIFYPLQGLFNVLVYTRPRYLRWRRWSGESRLTCLYHALFRFDTPIRNRQALPPPQNQREITEGESSTGGVAPPNELDPSDDPFGEAETVPFGGRTVTDPSISEAEEEKTSIGEP